MVRRRSPPPPKIPPGWTHHNGKGCPVDEQSRPAVMFRMGTETRRDVQTAEHWMMFAGGDCWTWGDRPEPMDIIAYLPEDDVVEIERLRLG